MDEYFDQEQWYYAVPLALLVAIVPLIVYLKKVPLVGVTYDFWTGEKDNYDFFSYYKMVAFITFVVFCIIMYLVKIYNKGLNIKKTWLYIPAVTYSIFVLLSALLSKYPSVAMYGFNDRYEGMFVILGYIIIFLLAINSTDNDGTIKVILGFLIFSALIIGIIGIFQFIGLDFYQTSFGKTSILPAEYQSSASTLNFLFGKNSIYSTLYHYNYVGSYMAMLAPLTITMFILHKSKKGKVVLGFIATIMFFNLIGCNSRAGFVGAFISSILLLFMLRKKAIKNWKLLLVIFFSVVVLTFGVDRILNGKIENYVSNLLARGTMNEDSYSNEKNLPLKDIIVEGKKAQIVTSTETLKIETENKIVKFQDENGKELTTTKQQEIGNLNILDDRYKDYIITFDNKDDNKILTVKKDKVLLYFKIDNLNITLVSNTGKAVEFGNVEKWGFNGNEKFASSRGFIWSRSIPLLKNTMLLGYGADTFAIYFPQDDYKGKMLAYDGDGVIQQLVDKPHNIYLQNALNNGVISIIALLTLFIGYIVLSIKTLIHSEFNDFKSIVSLGILVAITGYLVAGVFNDSVVSCASVFWVLLGVGTSININIKNEKLKALLNNKNGKVKSKHV